MDARLGRREGVGLGCVPYTYAEHALIADDVQGLRFVEVVAHEYLPLDQPRADGSESGEALCYAFAEGFAIGGRTQLVMSFAEWHAS